MNWLRLDGSLAKLSLLLPIIQGSTHLVSYTIFHFVEKSVLWVELLVGKWLHFCRWDREDKEVMCLFGNLEPIFSRHSPLRADLTKKIRASKKTTTAWKGTPYFTLCRIINFGNFELLCNGDILSCCGSLFHWNWPFFIQKSPQRTVQRLIYYTSLWATLFCTTFFCNFILLPTFFLFFFSSLSLERKKRETQ